MTPSNETPQVGHQADDGSWTNSLCKPCWIKSKNEIQSISIHSIKISG